jgi:hypothetical protein
MCWVTAKVVFAPSMLYRIFTLYVSKLFVLGILLTGAGMLAGDHGIGRVLRSVGMITCVALGAVGAAMGGVVLNWLPRLACPLCGRAGEVVLVGQVPGIDCPACGLVYCKRPLLNFGLTVIPPQSEERE